MPSKELIRITADSQIPLLGHIAYGVIDRGTNLIQVRPISTCPLSCIFCSTDAGPKSRHRKAEYIVELDYLVSVIEQVCEYKRVNDIEAHIDTVGDPLTYPHLPELVRRLSENHRIAVISMQTHGSILTEKLVDELADAKLSRINLSIDALNPELAKMLAGCSWYDVSKVAEIAKYIAQCTDIDLLIAPVWVPGINDSEMPKIIEFALSIGAGKKWPPLGIQKYVPHKRGRKPKGVKPMSWKAFYRKLREWEEEYGVKLILKPEDFNIYKVRPLPKVLHTGETVIAKVVAQGWLKGEWIATARGVSITVVDVPFEKPPIGAQVRVRIIRDKHGIYIARLAP